MMNNLMVQLSFSEILGGPILNLFILQMFQVFLAQVVELCIQDFIQLLSSLFKIKGTCEYYPLHQHRSILYIVLFIQLN